MKFLMLFVLFLSAQSSLAQELTVETNVDDEVSIEVASENLAGSLGLSYSANDKCIEVALTGEISTDLMSVQYQGNGEVEGSSIDASISAGAGITAAVQICLELQKGFVLDVLSTESETLPQRMVVVNFASNEKLRLPDREVPRIRFILKPNAGLEAGVKFQLEAYCLDRFRRKPESTDRFTYRVEIAPAFADYISRLDDKKPALGISVRQRCIWAARVLSPAMKMDFRNKIIVALDADNVTEQEKHQTLEKLEAFDFNHLRVTVTKNCPTDFLPSNEIQRLAAEFETPR